MQYCIRNGLSYAHWWNRGRDSVLQTKVTRSDSLVRHRRAVAQIKSEHSYGSPYPLRYIEIHVLLRVSHREEPGN